MSENMKDKNSSMKRRLKAKNRVIVFVVLLAVLMAGHIGWCIVHHVYDSTATTQVCSMCYMEESQCYCPECFSELLAKIDELERELAENNDGLCHNACSVHCPDLSVCGHKSLHNEYSEWVWYITGPENGCRFASRTVKAVCDLCCETVNESTESHEITEHEYVNGDSCIYCGYTRSTVVPDVTVTPVSPTVVPEPDATEPVDTPASTVCAHTRVGMNRSEVEWTDIASESECRIGKYVVTYSCSDCGVELRTDVLTQVDSQHSFNGRTCLKCGYKKSLGVGSYVEEGELTPPNNSWSYDDDVSEEVNPVE